MTNNELANLLEEAARRLRGDSLSCDSLQLYTEVEVAKLLRISRNTVREILPSVRISKHGTRYRATDIAAFIKSKQEKDY